MVIETLLKKVFCIGFVKNYFSVSYVKDISPLLEKWDHPNVAQDESIARVVRQDQACKEAGFFMWSSSPPHFKQLMKLYIHDLLT